jgi:hypothetical protein
VTKPRRANELAETLARALEEAGVETHEATVDVRARDDQVTITIRTGASSREARDDTFGSWFGGLLADEGVSQEEAARRIGVSVRAVGRWVRSESEPRYQELVRLCRAFGKVPPLLEPSAAEARSARRSG